MLDEVINQDVVDDGSIIEHEGLIRLVSFVTVGVRDRRAVADVVDDELVGGSAFAIGSAYGLSDKVRARADVLMSMSPMTFTHEFARAVLLEQIYRAKTITAKTGYHH